jgi:hypothetical protein
MDGWVHAEDFFDEGGEEWGLQSFVFEGFETSVAVRVVLKLFVVEGLPG